MIFHRKIKNKNTTKEKICTAIKYEHHKRNIDTKDQLTYSQRFK